MDLTWLTEKELEAQGAAVIAELKRRAVLELKSEEVQKVSDYMHQKEYGRAGAAVSDARLHRQAEEQVYHAFQTGARRSEVKPRYDLIPGTFLRRLANRFTGEMKAPGVATGGALKYGEGNWERGLPTSDVINHVMDHLNSYNDKFRAALTQALNRGDDPHKAMDWVREHMNQWYLVDDDLAGAAWGLAVLMHQEDTGFFHDTRFPRGGTSASGSQENPSSRRAGAHGQRTVKGSLGALFHDGPGTTPTPSSRTSGE